MGRITTTSFAIALAVTFGAATPASAQCNPGSATCAGGVFDIEGNVPDPGTLLTVDPNNSVKELGPLNGSPTKVGVIHTAAPPMLDTTNPNGQVDLNAIWTRTATGLDGHIWFYFAWARDSRTGSGFISIELQKAALGAACVYTNTNAELIASCNPWAGRSAGDFLILWDQQGSSRDLYKRVFQNVNGTLVLGGPVLLGSAKAQFSSDGSRGEAAVDLTADVFPTDGSCVSFANTIPGTVTGNSDTADYKDAVLSTFPPVTNCGLVRVKKVTDPVGLTGPAGGFAYTLARTNNDSVRFDGTKSIADTLAGHNDADTFSSILIGSNFTLTEAAQVAPWQYVSTACVLLRSSGTVTAGPATGFAVEGGVTTECTITNQLRQGAIKVIKHVINNNGGTAVAGDFTMFLGTGGISFSGSEAGVTSTLSEGTTFSVTEGLNQWAGLYNTQIGDPTLGPDCSGAIVAGVTKICHITNNDKPPSLTLNKIVVNDQGGTKAESAWTLTANGGAAGTLSGPGATGNTDVVSGATFSKGTYALSELLNPASPGVGVYTASAWSCVKNGGQAVAGSSVILDLGDSAVCTITNNDAPAAPSVATAQRAVLHDSATLTGIRAGAPDAANARVNFALYTNNACSGAPLGAESTTISAGGTATTVTGILVNTVGTVTYYWKVDYTGDQFNQSNSSCGKEQITVNINNNVQ